MVRITRWKSTLGGVLLILAALLASLWMQVSYYVDSGRLLMDVEKAIQGISGTRTTLGGIQITSGPKVILSNLSVNYPPDEPLVSVGLLTASFRWHDLLVGRISRATVEDVSLSLRFDEEGKLVVPSASDEGSGRMALPRIELINASVSIVKEPIRTTFHIARLTFRHKIPLGYELLATMNLPGLVDSVMVESSLAEDFSLLKTRGRIEIPRLSLEALGHYMAADLGLLSKPLDLDGDVSLSAELLTKGRLRLAARVEDASWNAVSGMNASFDLNTASPGKDNSLDFTGSLDLPRLRLNEKSVVSEGDTSLTLDMKGTLDLAEAPEKIFREMQWRLNSLRAKTVERVLLAWDLVQPGELSGTLLLSGLIQGSTSVLVHASILDGEFRGLRDTHADVDFRVSRNRDSTDVDLEARTRLSRLTIGNTELDIDKETGLQFDVSTQIAGNSPWNPDLLDFSVSVPALNLKVFTPAIQALPDGFTPLAGQGSVTGRFNRAGQGNASIAVAGMRVGEFLQADAELNVNDFGYRQDIGQLRASLGLQCSNLRMAAVPAQEVSLEFDLEYSMPQRRIHVQNVRLEMDELNAIVSLDANLTDSKPEILKASIHFDDLPIEYLVTLLGGFTNRLSSINGTQGTCAADLNATAKRGATAQLSSLTVEGKSKLSDSSGTGYDDVLLWNNLGAQWNGSIQMDLKNGTSETTINGVMSLAEGEFLYDTLYHDLNASPIEISLQGMVTNRGSMTLKAAAIHIPQTMDVNASGEIRSVSPLLCDLQVKADASLDRFLPNIVAPWLSGGSDRFNDSSASGTSSLEVSVSGQEKGFQLQGQCDINADSLSLPRLTSLQIENLVARIPFRIHKGSLSRTQPKEIPDGEIRFDQLSQPGMTLGSVVIPIQIRDNTLNIPKPLSVSIWDGQMHLDEFQMENVLDRGSRIYGRGRIENLALPLMSERLGFPPVDGILSCDSLQIQSQGGTLKLLSPLTATVFGGFLVVEEMQWLDYTERFPRLKLSMTINQIDLGQLSSRFPIGQIRGVLTGHVTELIIQAGLPTQFDIELETESRPRSQQQISVEAIKTILMVDPRTLRDQAVRQLLERTEMVYYNKIGLRARLEKNIISLTGTVPQGGQDYVMLGGGWWTPLNIIFHSSERIAFKEFVERMKSHFENVQSEEGISVKMN